MVDPRYTELAAEIADAITNRTGQVWNEQARRDLTAWLDEPDHRAQALQWLAYLPTDSLPSRLDQMEEYSLRRPLQDALTGTPPGRINPEDAPVFIQGTRRFWPWRRRR